MGSSRLSTGYTAISMGVQGTKGSSLSPWPPSPSSPVSECRETWHLWSGALANGLSLWVSSLLSFSLHNLQPCTLIPGLKGSSSVSGKIHFPSHHWLPLGGDERGGRDNILGRTWSPGSSWSELWFRRCKYVLMVASFTSFLFMGARRFPVPSFDVVPGVWSQSGVFNYPFMKLPKVASPFSDCSVETRRATISPSSPTLTPLWISIQTEKWE